MQSDYRFSAWQKSEIVLLFYENMFYCPWDFKGCLLIALHTVIDACPLLVKVSGEVHCDRGGSRSCYLLLVHE